MGELTVGQVMAGGVISCITMVRLQVEVLSQASVAVQVRVIPPWQPGVVASTKEMATLGSQASLAEAVPKLGCVGQLMGDTTVGQVMAGGVMSRTWIVRLQVEVLPQSSVAVQVRVTLKLAGQLPAVVASLKEMATLGSQASDAEAAPKLGVVPQFTGVTTVGQVRSEGSRV